MFNGGADWGRFSCVQDTILQTHISQCPCGGWHHHWPRDKCVLKGCSLSSRKDTRHRVCHRAERGTRRNWSSSSTDKIAVSPLPDMFQTVNYMYNSWIHIAFSIPPVRQLRKEILLLFYLISSGILVPEILPGKRKLGKLKGYWTASWEADYLAVTKEDLLETYFKSFLHSILLYFLPLFHSFHTFFCHIFNTFFPIILATGHHYSVSKLLKVFQNHPSSD